MTEQKTSIYSGKYEDFNWVGFGSGSGTNLRECAKIIKPKLIFSDRPNAKLLELEELADVPKMVIDSYRACGSWKKAKDDADAKKEYKEKSIRYNERILELLEGYQKGGIRIDLIVLGGYMRLIEEPVLSHFKDKIINVHPADLSILGSDNKRKYVGDNAVYDAINAGETKTRSSVIIVDKGEDHGEILTQGPEVAVKSDLLKKLSLNEYSKMHQGVQKEVSDWPALTTALKMIADGRIKLGAEKTHFNEWRTVYVDEKAMKYEGFRVKLNGG